jgi:hypothetical protein
MKRSYGDAAWSDVNRKGLRRRDGDPGFVDGNSQGANGARPERTYGAGRVVGRVRNPPSEMGGQDFQVVVAQSRTMITYNVLHCIITDRAKSGNGTREAFERRERRDFRFLYRLDIFRKPNEKSQAKAHATWGVPPYSHKPKRLGIVIEWTCRRCWCSTDWTSGFIRTTINRRTSI